jgi:ABC-type transport system involved in multi-copper enzyme maturation permease subunit
MKGPLLLFRLSLKRVWPLLWTMGLLLAAVQAFRVLIAAAMHNAGQFDQLAALLPVFVRDFFGASLPSVMTFNGIVCGVYFDAGFIIALLALAITLATLPAAELESGFADLILARPMARHWLITRTIALVLFAILLMLLMIVLGTWAGLALFAPPEVAWPSARQTAALALSLGMLAVSWSGVALAFGAACRRGVASATTSLLAFAAMLLDWAHRLWPPLDCIAWLSPFSYFDPYALVAGEPLCPENLLVLWAIAMTGYILAYLLMSLRDITR